MAATPDLTLKAGNTYPPFEAQCVQGVPPKAVDLTNAKAITLRMKGKETAHLVVAVVKLPVPAPLTGNVVYAWSKAAGDTNTADEYNAEVVVEWNDGTVESFPEKGYKIVLIEPRVE